MNYVAKQVENDSFFAPVCFTDLSAIQIVPEVFGKSLDFRKIKTDTEIGGFKSKLPIAMHVSPGTIASDGFEKLALGAALAGIPLIVEENSFVSFGVKALKEKLKPFSSNSKKFGALVIQANIHDLQLKAFEKAKEFGATCLELSLGSCASIGCCAGMKTADPKEAERFEKAGYIVFKENSASHCYSSPANVSEEELGEKLVKYSGLDLPIWVRVSAGAGITKLIQLLQKIKRENEIPLNCLTVDGLCNSASFSQLHAVKGCGLPSAALFGVLEDKPSFDIVLAGDYSTSEDIAKALMLGAKAVELPENCFAEAANAAKEGKKNCVECLAKALERELQLVCSMQRVESVEELHRKKKNLFALSKEAGDLFGVSCNPKTFL